MQEATLIHLTNLHFHKKTGPLLEYKVRSFFAYSTFSV